LEGLISSRDFEEGVVNGWRGKRGINSMEIKEWSVHIQMFLVAKSLTFGFFKVSAT
jgi:hypothetical protein